MLMLTLRFRGTLWLLEDNMEDITRLPILFLSRLHGYKTQRRCQGVHCRSRRARSA